ncbi:unnamed protein product [Lathyrus oleraceus]|uniref:WAT1-related protein n=1 Tax=Pisum sativum TaxID=3888 RepID=A0A9D4XRF5_PEA|nr:WAT1-related protein At4g30420-like [Pisum sativum]KAI5423391.1 hypothetical protein KIW84_046379 [Pisum sativum]
MKYYLPIMVMVLIQFIYSGMTLWNRVALVEGMSPRVFVVYRHAFATIFLAPNAYLSSRRDSTSCSLNLRSFCLIFITSLIGITLNQNLFYEGLYLTSSSITSAMTNLVPAITFVIAAFAGMERVNIRSLRTIAKIFGTIICVSGAVSNTLLKGPKLLNSSLEGDANWLLGCLFLFGSMVAWSAFLILQVPAYASHPNSLSLAAWMCLMATLQSLAVTLFLDPNLNAWKIISLFQFGCILYSGVIGSGVALYLQAWCISKRGPLFSAMFNPLLTLIVTILATLWLHEEIYIGSLIGAIGVIIGLYIVLWGKAKDVVDLQEKIVDNESCGKTYLKSGLKDPLLPN